MSTPINARPTIHRPSFAPEHLRTPKIRPIPADDECFSSAIARAMAELLDCGEATCTNCGKCEGKVDDSNESDMTNSFVADYTPEAQSITEQSENEQLEWNHGAIAMAEMYKDMMLMGGYKA